MLSIETLMEEIQPLVPEKYVCDYREMKNSTFWNFRSIRALMRRSKSLVFQWNPPLQV